MHRSRPDAVADALWPRWDHLRNTQLDLDDYNRMYLHRYLQDLDYNLYLVQHLVETAELQQIPETVIDLGGGIGFNTAYLKERFPTSRIVHLDVDAMSSKAAQEVHAALGLGAIEYVIGELQDAHALIDDTTFICSRDVIEHIYDLDAFFSLSGKAMANAHNTAAIHGSFFRSREFRQIHHRAEFVGMESPAIKARDHRQPYLVMREAIIRERFPGKSESEILRLATASRGLNVVDIQQFVDSGIYPPDLAGCLYTNTCDPLTGNWAERCLRPSDYRRMAGPHKLRFRYPSYNTIRRSGLRGAALRVLNIFASLPIHRLQASFTLVYSNPHISH